MSQNFSATTTGEALCWAVHLSIYDYTCVHIKSEENVWADLLVHWSASPTIRLLVHVSALPSSTDEKFDWPGLDKIAASQGTNLASQPPGLQLKDGIWLSKAGAMWIPDSADDLRLRLHIIAHTGPAGHRSFYNPDWSLRSAF